MKGKWAKGIPPRFFAWIIKDQLAVSERPGGYARNHRRVRRQEEILWLRGEGFTRVVSLLTSPHNLHAYDELGMAWAHVPFGPQDDPHVILPDAYAQLREWVAAGECLLVHQEELNDRLMGVVAGYLRWSGLVPAGPQAISVVERIMHRQMGPDGRELVAMALDLAGAGGCPELVRVRAKTSEASSLPDGPAPAQRGAGPSEVAETVSPAPTETVFPAPTETVSPAPTEAAVPAGEGAAPPPPREAAGEEPPREVAAEEAGVPDEVAEESAVPDEVAGVGVAPGPEEAAPVGEAAAHSTNDSRLAPAPEPVPVAALVEAAAPYGPLVDADLERRAD